MENLENKDSKLFWDAVRVLREVRQAASGAFTVAFIVENVMMDPDPERTIGDNLQCRAVKIGAGPVCPATRDRLFWCNFQIKTQEGETLQNGPMLDEFFLKKTKDRLTDFWDKGWSEPPNFRGNIPTLQG